MNALGWVATMQGGTELPFTLTPVSYWTDRKRFIHATAYAHLAGAVSLASVQTREPLFEIRGTVRRPLMRGGYVTKLVLREASET